jgi:hypothetical protein
MLQATENQLSRALRKSKRREEVRRPAVRRVEHREKRREDPSPPPSGILSQEAVAAFERTVHELVHLHALLVTAACRQKNQGKETSP